MTLFTTQDNALPAPGIPLASPIFSATLSTEEKLTLRQQQAQPIINNIKAWLEKNIMQVPPQTALGKALHYLHNQWPRLIRYLEHGDYPIDNTTNGATDCGAFGSKICGVTASEGGEDESPSRPLSLA